MRFGSNKIPGLEPRPDALPLASLLPYVACGRIGDFDHLHLLDNGALGVALRFEVPVVDTSVDAEENVADAIDRALRTLAVGVRWQWFVQAAPYVEPELRTYLRQEGRDAVSKACVDHFVERWRRAQREGFFPDDPSLNFFPRSQCILLALKSPPMFQPRSLADIMLRRDSHFEQHARTFIENVRQVQSVLSTVDLEPLVLDGDELANWVANMLFPWRRFSRGPIKAGHHSVSQAVAALGTIEEVGWDGFRTVCCGEQAHHRAVSLLWHPRMVEAGMLNRLILLRPSLTVVLHAQVLASTNTALQLKAQNLLNARSGSWFNQVETQARAQALETVEQRLFSEGERLVEGRLQVHIVERTRDEADDAARAVSAYLHEMEIEAAVEEDVASSLILHGCLPFCGGPHLERRLNRVRRFLSRDFADLHPAGGCWTGTRPAGEAVASNKEPIVLYATPVGEPLFLDPTRAERNPHALVVGQSGSGKSFFVHDYLLHLWRIPHVRLYLISIKPDYRKLALLLGRYVELTLDSVESLNPFGGAPTLENQARSVAALSLMIHEGRPDQRLSREQEVALQEAVAGASNANWDAGSGRALRETVLEDICVELEKRPGAIGRELSLRLFPYRRGPYRRLFNGPRTLAAEDRFVFFNLGQMLRQPCSAAASFCIFSLIDQVMYDPGLRGVPKGLIADEVWALVQDPYAAAILERSLKAYRSLGGFALPIVQDPRDLDTAAGRVILVNTATKIVLPMDRSGQDEISRYVRLNERELELIRGLRLVKRRYSEFFVSIEGIRSAKGMIIPDPLRYAISTTDPSDEAELDALFLRCGDMLQSVQHFAREMPYGVRQPQSTARHGAGFSRWLPLVALSLGAALLLAWFATRSPRTSVPPTVAAVSTMTAASAAQRAVELLTPHTEPSGHSADAGASRPIDQTVGHVAESLAGAISPSIADGPPNPKTSPADERGEAPRDRGRAGTALASRGERTTPPRSAVPDVIESPNADVAEDPLAAMTVRADLVLQNASTLPRVLLEVRQDDQPARARIGSPREEAGTTPSAWFEIGDSPAPGWTLVQVLESTATLLSPSGELVQLTVTPPDRP